MPTTIRCAARPDSVAATVGRLHDRAHAVQPTGDDRVDGRSVDRPLGVVRAEYPGPKSQRQQQRDRHRNRDDEDDRRRRRASPSPAIQRGTSMKLAPMKAAKAPAAVATEFIVTTCSRGTTWGSDADRPDATKRAKPLASNAPHSSGRSPAPTARIVPIATDHHQAAHVGADQHPASIPTVHQRAGERPQQRVRQEQHRESARDRHRVGGSIGVEQQRAGHPRLRTGRRRTGLPCAAAAVARSRANCAPIAKVRRMRAVASGCLNHRTHFHDSARLGQTRLLCSPPPSPTVQIFVCRACLSRAMLRRVR